jgi:hypothetical protein
MLISSEYSSIDHNLYTSWSVSIKNKKCVQEITMRDTKAMEVNVVESNP